MSLNYEIRHLKHFFALAEELNFRRAAEKLNIAQPALSRSLQKLESDLGVILFIRTTRLVELTDAGKAFHAGAHQAFLSLIDAEKSAMRVKIGEEGSLRIGYTNFAITGQLPQLLKAFKDSYPLIRLELMHQFSADQIESLEKERLDFGFITGPLIYKGITSFPFQQDPLIAIVPDSHPLSHKPSIDLIDLRHESFILGNTNNWTHFFKIIKRVCRNAGFMPNIVEEAYDTEAILGLVSSGFGISLHAGTVKNYYRKGVKIIDINDHLDTISTELITFNPAQSPIKKIFFDFARSYSKGLKS
ncbi:LysR substrate-binding domain-containing protein [Vibrio lentus]|uniref:LysR family transcriptional regulator n=1 Tax=Vibrio lentus TaxID=136468 RepID=A0A2N7K0R7_9VIBR|nr:LysR substrate-binding domain-containing protein [Vibrio lentus]PMM66757.1 LysR family transcriptional regulator [Vibrio lentus]